MRYIKIELEIFLASKLIVCLTFFPSSNYCVVQVNTLYDVWSHAIMYSGSFQKHVVNAIKREAKI